MAFQANGSRQLRELQQYITQVLSNKRIANAPAIAREIIDGFRTSRMPSSILTLPEDVLHLLFIEIANTIGPNDEWHVRDKSLTVLTKASEPDFAKLLRSTPPADWRARFARTYFATKQFIINIKMKEGGIKSVQKMIAAFWDNIYLDTYLRHDRHSEIRVREIVVVIEPQPSHLDDIEPESGVRYYIKVNPRTEQISVRMLHQYKAEYLVAWTPRVTVLGAIKEFFAPDKQGRGGVPQHKGLKYDDIGDLAHEIIEAAAEVPIDYDISMRTSILQRQRTYREKREARSKNDRPLTGNVTDDEEYDQGNS